MNELIQKITVFFSELSEKEIKLYSGIALCIITLSILLGTYSYYSSIQQIKKQIRMTNTKRREIKTLLSKYNQIKKQKEKVDELISQDKGFYLKRHFDAIIKSLDIPYLLVKEPVPVEKESKKGYSEISLTASFHRANMKQLAELLSKIEQKKRVYIKKLDITKSKHSNTLSFVIVIATLQSHSNVSETTG